VAKKKSDVVPSSGAAGELLDAVTKEFLPKVEDYSCYDKKVEDMPTGKTILALDREAQAILVNTALDRLEELELKIASFHPQLKGIEENNPHLKPGWLTLSNPRYVLLEVLRALLRRSLPLNEETVIRLFQWPIQAANHVSDYTYPLSGLATAAEAFAKENKVSDCVRAVLESFIALLHKNTRDKDCRKIADRIQALLSGGPTIQLESGEAWSDAALADLSRMKTRMRQAWDALLLYCQLGGKGKYSERWRNESGAMLDAVGFDAFKQHVLRWFSLVDKPRTQPIERRNASEPNYDQLIKEPHVEMLRGLVWCCGLRDDAELARGITHLALSSYRKIPGKGPVWCPWAMRAWRP
jgi:hypothetical protein